jgi:hypothetical protein
MHGWDFLYTGESNRWFLRIVSYHLSFFGLNVTL